MTTKLNYSSVHEVTFYQARCTNCGEICDDYGDFAAWADSSTPIESVVDGYDWFRRTLDGGLEELLCPDCIACDVCGAKPASNVDGDHLRCDEHEEYGFGVTQ